MIKLKDMGTTGLLDYSRGGEYGETRKRHMRLVNAVKVLRVRGYSDKAVETFRRLVQAAR